MNWKNFLSTVSETLLNSEDLREEFKNNSSNWLGFEGASEDAIKNHEDRLNVSLPPSYRDFLKTTNGFKQLNCFIWDILSVDKIEWLEAFDPQFFKLYSTEFKDTFHASDEKYFIYGEQQKSIDFRSDYLVNSLVVSGWGDASIILLNPSVKFGDEWEAWMFATWIFGPIRYKSFEILMKEEFASYIELRNTEE